MLAFAANSLLCRLALRHELIDAASFATFRVLFGALLLGILSYPRWRTRGRPTGDWRAAFMLFGYMVFFSFAYLSLSAGTGALILFGAVQLTMFIVALRQGERFSPLSWAGLALAILGLVYLVSPGVTAPIRWVQSSWPWRASPGGFIRCWAKTRSIRSKPQRATSSIRFPW